jgi:hypothetical protein
LQQTRLFGAQGRASSGLQQVELGGQQSWASPGLQHLLLAGQHAALAPAGQHLGLSLPQHPSAPVLGSSQQTSVLGSQNWPPLQGVLQLPSAVQREPGGQQPFGQQTGLAAGQQPAGAAPTLQQAPVVQALPQAPQFWLVAPSTHWPPQHSLPGPHTWPPASAQPPQLFSSVCGSTHLPLHLI